MSHVWDELLGEDDRLVIRMGRYGQRRGLGACPAFLVIDCQYNYVGADRPLAEQLDEWPAGGGARAWAAVREIGHLLPAVRRAGVPVVYSRNVAKGTVRFDSFQAKAGWDHRRTLEGDPGTKIVKELAPQQDDIVIDKSYASLFYGTPLQTYLVALHVDSLILTGVSTSGCVRATVVDGVTRGYACAVVENAVADRIAVSHQVTLLDIWMKYSDVMPSSEVEQYLADTVKSAPKTNV